MRVVGKAEASITMTSDASGCGALSGGNWFMLQWTDTYQGCHSQRVGTHRGGGSIMGQRVAGKDGQGVAVVSAVNRGASRDRDAMHLMRCLASI